MMADSALVLFSGGQDSTTCLAWALTRFARVETIGFDYGQRHHAELEARQRVLAAFRTRFPDWAPRLGDDHMFTLDVLKQIDIALIAYGTLPDQKACEQNAALAADAFAINATSVIALATLCYLGMSAYFTR